MRAVAIALAAGVAVPLLAAGLVAIGIPRCIDSPRFLNPTALLWAGAGVGLIAGGAALQSGRVSWLGGAVALVGAALLAVALVGPPYHSCGQLQMFRT